MANKSEARAFKIFGLFPVSTFISVVTGYMYKYGRFLFQKNPIDLGEIIRIKFS